MRALLDTSIIFDKLMRRPLDVEGLDRIEIMHAFDDVSLWVSAKSISDIFYVIRKEIGSEAAYVLLGKSLVNLHICSIDESDITRALERRWPDFEDCLIDACAEKIKADFLITRDAKGFEKSRIPHGTASEFMEFVKAKLNVEYGIVDL